MGIRVDGPAVIALLLLASLAGAQSVSVSTPIVESTNAVSTVTVAVSSGAPANVPGSAQIGSATTDTPPALDAAKSFQTAAVQAMLDLAAAYSEKRRTLFMRLISDDFLGDLGTLEDALSSDFRSYRTIVLSIVPGSVVVHKDQAAVQFRYNMTLTNDLGNNTNFAGAASYVFKREDDGKVRLFKMSGPQLFGTSLSSIENPVARSQGAQPSGTSTAPVPPCSASTVQGSAQINSGGEGFQFSNQTINPSGGDMALNVSGGQGTIVMFGGSGGGARRPGGKDPILDMGPCSFSTFTKDPTAISDASAPVNVGDCYAIRTSEGFYAAIMVTYFNPGSGAAPGVMNFNYKYQPSGQTCF